MTPDGDFLIQAQGCIERVVRAKRSELLSAAGKIKIEMKDNRTPVTELDKSFEIEIKEALRKLDPSIGFEGEEFGVEGNRETFWLIDPIDGTEAFIRGLPFFRNIVTLIDAGEPVFTFIYKPFFDELYIAAKGEGAYKNGKAISVSHRPLEHARIEVHFPGNNHATWALMETLSSKINAVRLTGDFTPVADGGLDGLLVYNGGGGPWDFAPRALLIQEAGGRVTNIGSDTYDYKKNTMLATNPIIHDDLMKIITDATQS